MFTEFLICWCSFNIWRTHNGKSHSLSLSQPGIGPALPPRLAPQPCIWKVQDQASVLFGVILIIVLRNGKSASVWEKLCNRSPLAQGEISLCGCFTKHVWKKPNHTCLVISTRMCNKTHLCGQSHTAGPCVVCGFYHTRVGKTKHVWK